MFQATPGEKEGKVTQRLFKFGFDHFWSVLLQVDVLSLGLFEGFFCMSYHVNLHCLCQGTW